MHRCAGPTGTAATKAAEEVEVRLNQDAPADAALPRFDPDAFPTSTDTLYLLSKDGAGSSGPLVAAMTDQVMRYGVRRAEARGGRLDPPILCMLDEAANICPLADLPQLYSHYGGRGIMLVTILQTFQQGTTLWGERGMRVCAAPITGHVRDLASGVGQVDGGVAGGLGDPGRGRVGGGAKDANSAAAVDCCTRSDVRENGSPMRGTTRPDVPAAHS